MLNSDQLNKPEALHARDLTGKVRLISFSIAATPAADTVFLVAKLPAGRGRLLPSFCVVASSVSGGTWTLGNLAFRNADMTKGTTPAASITTSPTADANEAATFPDLIAAEGWTYESIEDVGITLTTSANVAAGSKVVGSIAYVQE